MDNQPVQAPVSAQPPQQPIVDQPPQSHRSWLRKTPVLIALVLIVFAATIYGVYAWQHKKTANLQSQISSLQARVNQLSQTTKQSSTLPPATVDSNAGYLVVNEWGLRFKIPSGLTDVRYKIIDNTVGGDSDLAIYAKPTGSNVQYRNDYTALNQNGYLRYGIGQAYRSSDSTKNGGGGQTVTGKKLGNYYYYTAWAFNSLATGVACVGLYGGSSDADCQAEGIAFQLVNQGDNALLNTIELAK